MSNGRVFHGSASASLIPGRLPVPTPPGGIFRGRYVFLAEGECPIGLQRRLARWPLLDLAATSLRRDTRSRSHHVRPSASTREDLPESSSGFTYPVGIDDLRDLGLNVCGIHAPVPVWKSYGSMQRCNSLAPVKFSR